MKPAGPREGQEIGVGIQDRDPSVTAILTEVADLEGLRHEWDDLFTDVGRGSFFLRWHWVHLWWRDLAPPGSSPFIISCRDASGRLIGLAPLYLTRYTVAGIPYAREIRFIGSNPRERTSEYLDLMARRGHERLVGQSIAAALLRAPAWDRLWLAFLPAGSEILPHFHPALGAAASVSPGPPAHIIDTTSGWDAYLKDLGPALRKNIGYYTRRLLKTHRCEFSRVGTSKELDEAVGALIRLHQARWRAKGEPGSFARPRFDTFLRDAMRDSFDTDRLRLWTLAIDGEMAATLLAFVDRGVVHYFQGGFDPAYARDSLGTVMLAMCVRDCFEAGDVREFDFMAGQGGYKESWTTMTRPNLELTMTRPGAGTLAYLAVARGERLARLLLKATLPRTLRAAARRWAALWRAG